MLRTYLTPISLSAKSDVDVNIMINNGCHRDRIDISRQRPQPEVERIKSSMIVNPTREVTAPVSTAPLTKGQRTRHRLLAAAERVFEKDGFLEARVADIATQAAVAHGTFYTYFESKTDIFRAVLTEFLPSIYQTTNYGDGEYPTPYQRVEFGNRRFFEVYRDRSKMLALLEQTATFDPEVKMLRTTLRHTAERGIRRNIVRMQENGLVDPDLNADIAASCLVAMATHSYYTWLVMDGRDYDEDESIITLSRLWASALGLKPEPTDRPEYQWATRAAKTNPPKVSRTAPSDDPATSP